MSQHRDELLVRVDIGGLGIDLIVNHPVLSQKIRQRYQYYPPAVSERFVAEIAIAGDLPLASLLTLNADFDSGVLLYDAPGCQGYIDAALKKGSLRLNTSQPLEEVDYFLRIACALLAFDAGGLLLHAAGVLHAGQAHIFFGYSGSGKSTVASLSAPDEIINDDLVLFMPVSDGWQAYATPFWNVYQSQPPTKPGQTAGLYRLVQDRRVYLEEISRAYALAELVSSVPVISADPSRSQELLQRCQVILESTPVYRLHFLMDASFWRVIDEANQNL